MGVDITEFRVYNGPKNLHLCEFHMDSHDGKVVGHGFSLLSGVHFPRRLMGPTSQNLGVSKSSDSMLSCSRFY